MKHFSLFTLFLFSLLPLQNLEAAKIYRHIPFTVSVSSGENIRVDYDFSGKSGIKCTARPAAFKIEFNYKGREKTAVLPIILENGHIPTAASEELADVAGHFTITSRVPLSHRQEVSCDYIDRQ